MDCIKIRQLEVFAYHGCNEEEKINGQRFYVDADLFTDVRTPGMSDDLEETVNYSKACKFINKFMTENRFDLIEAVAEQTARGLLKEFPKIREVELTINKPNAPIKLPFGNVAVTVRRKWSRAYLSIGSNMGDKEEYLNQAIEGLYDDENCRVSIVSKFIETEPYGPVEQDNFLNGCVEIETLYSPKELLRKVNIIELEAGRTREIHWGPRTLDIDIILFDNEIVNLPDLKIPHIEMHKRLFVLEPLNQIAPYAVHPIFNKMVSQLLEDLQPQNKCSGCGGCSFRQQND
ncbi:2-amino-4-hydroxy-6-hydroxymethyldihydropteridine diphosphokinase [Eubacterium sp.]|uniref:2-amino-4-hydroxy-6- hydroxymethyldihydropteridine diphosphokinase n=1 Tax=Eubacterium sp. TaxID=142586 RepID=UPI003520FB25